MTGNGPKTVLVTGASSGIGSAIATQAAAAGWSVIAGYGSGSDRAAELVSQIEAVGGTAVPAHLPLHDPDAITSAIETLTAAGQMPDALVLNASPPFSTTSFIKVTPEDFREQFEACVVGNHALIAALWKQSFRKKRDGHIVGLLTAALGPPPTPQMTPYITAKAALRTLLQCAAVEYGRGGLRVSLVSPGFTETPMLEGFNELLLDMARSQMENGRFLTPEEVASTVVSALANPPAAADVTDVPIQVSSQR